MHHRTINPAKHNSGVNRQNTFSVFGYKGFLRIICFSKRYDVGDRTIDQRHDLGRYTFHDLLVLDFISMPIVDVRNAAFAMILNPVHAVATKTHR